MFDQYLLPVTTAATFFPILAVVMVVPFSLVAYRRRGRLGWRRAVVFFTFLYCAVAAFFLTLMPLPRDPQAVCQAFPQAAHPQWVPGNFVSDFTREAHGHYGPAALLANPSLYQVAFNVALLVPLGFFLRYYTGRGLAAATAAGLGMSLMFELTQGTGVWGLYPCPYRLADMDDLLLNTSGAMLGWLLAGPALRVLPDLVAHDEVALRSTDVVFGRRLWALAFDAVASVTTSVVATFGWWHVGGTAVQAAALAPLVTTVVWFVVLPKLSGGATLGKRLVRITLVGRDGNAPTWGALLVRYLVVLVLAGAAGALVSGAADRRVSVLLLFGLALAAAFAAALIVLVRADRLGPHEWFSGVRNACRGGELRRPAARHRRDWSRIAVSRPSGDDVTVYGRQHGLRRPPQRLAQELLEVR